MITHTHSKWKHTIIFICGTFLGGMIILNTYIFCCINKEESVKLEQVLINKQYKDCLIKNYEEVTNIDNDSICILFKTK